MGANMSSEAPLEPKESLYDVLGVEKTANATELKHAYRRMALELHPDRNYQNEADATAKFTKIQAAYDILTDEIERKWYDDHFDTFEYTEYNGKVTKTSEILGYLGPQFLSTLDPKSDKMYRMVTEFFERLKNEEAEAAFQLSLSEPPPTADAPQFGHLDAPWSQVKTWYDIWRSFSTVKSFAWEDLYPSHHADDRRTRRNFELRNKRIREASKREYSKAVRTLVGVLRDMDIRVQQQRQKQKSNSAEARAQAQAQAQAAKVDRKSDGGYQQQEWERTGDLDVDADSLECVACEEIFSTTQELHAHELSQKHARAVHELRRMMKEEDQLLAADRPSRHSSPGTKKNDWKAGGTTGTAPKINGINDEDTCSPPLAELQDLSVENIINQMDNHKQKSQAIPKKDGKAKQRRRKKATANVDFVIQCGTCNTEFGSLPELLSHKSQVKH